MNKEQLEHAAEQAGVKYALTGGTGIRYSEALANQSQCHRDKYTPYVDGFLAGHAAALASHKGQYPNFLPVLIENYNAAKTVDAESEAEIFVHPTIRENVWEVYEDLIAIYKRLPVAALAGPHPQ